VNFLNISNRLILDHYRRTGGHRAREVAYLKSEIDLKELLKPLQFSFEECFYCAENSKRADVFEVLDEFSKPDKPWWVQVVKDPYLQISLTPEQVRKSWFDGTPYCEATEVFGQAEIIIEERNCGSYYQIPFEQIREILYMYLRRYKILAAERCIYQIILFKKYTPGLHNITNIIGQSVLSLRIERELGIALDYSEAHAGRCLYCDFLKPSRLERIGKEFHIEKTRFFQTLCLHAERNPFGVQIIPQRHQSNFLNVTTEEIDDLANIWYGLFRRFYKLFGDIGFEFCLDSSPVGKQFSDYHWHFDISPVFPNNFYTVYQPHLFINPVKPENADRILREVKVD
jgi:UDPglucose--hexose-1-phosphate uridylyltransferase